MFYATKPQRSQRRFINAPAGIENNIVAITIELAKTRTLLFEKEDSSSAAHYLPNNKVRGWPPQNDKP
jgi:hypothetical protein